MNLKDIKRRERRFYRKIENDQIKYDVKTDTKTPEVIPKENADLLFSEENRGAEKKEIIENILKEIKNNINPDIDEITDIIFAQLNNSHVEIDQKTVKEAVCRHQRREKDQTEEKTTNFTERKRLETVIDDILDQLSKSDSLEKKHFEEKNKKEKDLSEDKRNRRSKKEEPEKKKDLSKEENKKTKKETPIKEDLDTEDIESDDLDEDDLGLKF
jgi:hypothetical protein